MAKYHKVPLWSEAHWEQIAEYGKQMRHMRQTDFWVPSSLAVPKMYADGHWSFDFSRCERLIHLYFHMGFRYIESGTPLFRKDWADEHFVLAVGDKIVPALSE